MLVLIFFNMFLGGVNLLKNVGFYFLDLTNNKA